MRICVLPPWSDKIHTIFGMIMYVIYTDKFVVALSHRRNTAKKKLLNTETIIQDGPENECRTFRAFIIS